MPPRIPGPIFVPGKGQRTTGTYDQVKRIAKEAKDKKAAEKVRDAPFARGTGKAAPAVVKPPVVAPKRAPVPARAAPAAVRPKPSPAKPPAAKAPARKPKKSTPSRAPAQAPAAAAVSPAEQIVQTALAPLYAQLDAAKREQGIQDKSRQDALSGFTQEIIAALNPVAGQVGSDYDRAIQQTDQLAQTASTGLMNANPTAQVQADLAAIGAPQAQQDQIAARNQQVFGGGGSVLNYTQGTLPGSGLAESKAAQQAFSRNLPSIFAAEGQNALKSFLFESAKNSRLLADQRQEVNLKRPGLLLEAEGALAKQDIDRRAIAVNEAWTRAKLGKQAFDQQATTVRLGQSQQGLNIRKADMISSLYGVDTAGNLTLDGRRVAALEQKNAKANKGITPGKYAQLKKDALKQADLYYYGDEEKGVGAITYQQALSKLMSGYSLRLADAQKLLNTYYQPGEDGRPFITFQQREALRRKGVSKAKINAAMYDGQLAQALLGRL